MIRIGSTRFGGDIWIPVFGPVAVLIRHQVGAGWKSRSARFHFGPANCRIATVGWDATGSSWIPSWRGRVDLT